MASLPSKGTCFVNFYVDFLHEKGRNTVLDHALAGLGEVNVYLAVSVKASSRVAGSVPTAARSSLGLTYFKAA